MIPVDLVVLVDITVVTLAGLEDNGLGGFFFGEVEIVECDDRRSTGITTKRRVLILNGSEVLILITEQELPHSSGGCEPVQSNVDANVANVLVEVSIYGLFSELLDEEVGAKPALEGKLAEELAQREAREIGALVVEVFGHEEFVLDGFGFFVPLGEGGACFELGEGWWWVESDGGVVPLDKSELVVGAIWVRSDIAAILLVKC